MSLTSGNIEREDFTPSENLSSLFTLPTQNRLSSSTSNQNIILNPDAIWTILALIEQSPTDKQLSLLDDLLFYIRHFPLNTLILTHKTQEKLPNNTTKNIIEHLLDYCLRVLESNPKVSSKIGEIITALYQYNPLEKCHFTVLYSFLSEKYYQQSLNGDAIFFTIDLLRKLISLQIPKPDEPSTFFYFTGINSGLVAEPQRQIQWNSHNGFGISVWFYLDNIQHEENTLAKKPSMKLFTIFSEGQGGVEAYFIGRDLYYRTISRTYSEATTHEPGAKLGSLKPNKWYYLGLEHANGKGIGKSSLKVVLNMETRDLGDLQFPNIENNAQISKFVIGENFVGRISTILLFKNPLGQNKLSEIYSTFNLGIQNENVLKGAQGYLEKILDKIELLYTPLRADHQTAFDILNNHHTTLTGNTGISIKDPAKLRIGALGGVASLLPFFNFLKYVDISKHPNILDDLWRLVIDLFKNFPEAQFEASKIGFFRIIGQLLIEIEKNLVTSTSIELLAEIRNTLNYPKLAEEMFVDLLWNIRIYEHAEPSVLNQHWAYIKTIYLQNPTLYVNLFDVRKILDLIVDKFDVRFQQLSAENSKTDWSCSSTPEFKEAEAAFGPILSIIESVLLTGRESVSDNVIPLVNLLTLRCSSYLHLLVLRILQNIVSDKRDDSAFTSRIYVKVIVENKGALSLLNLIAQTSCLDVKAACIKLFNLIMSHPANTSNKTEITQYLSSIIWNPATLQKDQEINFDQLFEKSEAPKESTEQLETLQITKVSKSFPKTSKLSLSNFEAEPNFSKSATSSSLQSSLQGDLIGSATEKKLAEMSLNLRNSIPKDRLGETESFRKNKTFEFSRANKPTNDFGGLKDFGSTLPQISELAGGQTEEVTLEIPSFKIKKKPQATSTSTSTTELKKGGKGKPKFNLEIQADDETPEDSQATKIESEKINEETTKIEEPVQVEEPKKVEENKESEEFVLEKPFPKPGGFKKKNLKNLAIVSELDNEDQGGAPEVKKGFGLSIDTSDKPEQKENTNNAPLEETQTTQAESEKTEVKEEAKQEETKEPEVELALPKPKAKGKGLGMGKKKGFAMTMQLDVEAINQEFTIGGEKGQKVLSENELNQILEVAMKEVYKLANECVEYMKAKEKEEEEEKGKEKEKEKPSLFEETKEQEADPNEGYRPPKNMPQSVRGNKRIDFSFKGNKPLLELGNEVLNSSTKEPEFSKPLGLKPTLDMIKETTPKTGRSEEYQVSSNLDIASPEQNQPIIFKTTPKGQGEIGSLGDAPQQPSRFEGIYNALVEWLLHKQPTCPPSNVVIDDTDKICCVEVLPVLINFFKHADEPAKQKMMQDIYVLVKWNPANCVSILKVPEFHSFLLDTLYDYQILLYNSELDANSTVIWELGTKAHTVILKHALLQEQEGYKHLQNLFLWLHNKKAFALNKPNPIKYEKGAQYLIRHLWANLLEAFTEPSVSSKIPIDSPYWKNLQQTIFYTQEIVASVFRAEEQGSETAESNSQRISSLSNVRTKLNAGEDFPYNFNSIFVKNYWVDWKLCETLMKVLEHNWTAAKIQEIEKGNQEDGVRALKILFGESIENNAQGRGHLLKAIFELMTCYLEDTIDSKNTPGTKFVCERIERLIKFILAVGEEAKEDNTLISEKDFLIGSVLYTLVFLYQVIDKAQATQQTQISCVLDCIGNILKATSKSSTQSGGPKRGKNIQFSNAFKNPNQFPSPIGLSSGIFETLNIGIEGLGSAGGLSEIDHAAIKEEWRERVFEEKVLALIKRYYGRSWTEIHKDLRKNFEEKALILNQTVSEQEKVIEDTRERNKKEITELAVNICESEGQRKADNLHYSEEHQNIGKELWRKLWKKLRVYAGLWKHPEFYDQIDCKESKENEGKANIKNKELYKHKMAKYEVKSRARPFLKVKLQEPDYVEKTENRLEERRQREKESLTQINERVCQTLSEGDQQNDNAQSEDSKGIFLTGAPKVTTTPWKGSKGLLIGATSNIPTNQFMTSPLRFDNVTSNKTYTASPSTKLETSIREEVFLSKRCQWIKPLLVKEGWFQITSHRLIFISDKSESQESNAFFAERNGNSSCQKGNREWPLDFVREIQKKQILQKRTALEIYLVDGSTFLFNFPEGELEEVSQKLVRMRKTRCPNLVYYGSLDSRKILDKANITKRWQNCEMTNFEYLMWLNSLSGRSFNDITQYPIFPWIISNFSSPQLNLEDSQIYRDLSKPKEGQANITSQNTATQSTSTTRNKKKIVISIPDSSQEDTPSLEAPSNNANNTTIWYCSPLTALQYLQNFEPFTQGINKLNRKGIKPLNDKSFGSLEELYTKTSEELIPEFFFLPDILAKWEANNKGTHVQLPQWTGDSFHRLTTTLRNALESDEVSKHLHTWIDIVFGCKQTSKEGQASLQENKLTEQALYTGQQPLQLFTKPHPPRNITERENQDQKLVVDPTADVRVYRPPSKKKGKDEGGVSGLLGDLEKLGDNALIKMKVISDSRLIGLRKDGRLTYFKWWSAPINQELPAGTPFKCGIEKEKVARLNKGKHDWCDNLDYSVKYVSYPATFLNMGKIIVAGGYWDGRLSLFSTDTDSLIEAYFYHSDTITAIANDQKENFLVTGSKSGECIVWKISPELTKLTAKFHFYDHDSTINDIFISNDLRLFATASNDGKINIYQFIVGQLLRTIHHPLHLPIQTVVLSSCPLPSVIFSSEQNQGLYSYSINGKLLEQITTNSSNITSPLIIKDANSMEYLVHGNEKGELYLRKLPFFDYSRKWDVSLHVPVLTALVSKDKRYMFCGCSDGEFSVLTDPSLSLSGQNQIKKS